MRRLAAWTERLDAYLVACQKRAFRWGEHDCVLFACGAVQAMTGEHPMPALRGRYTSARGAARAMAAYGIRNLEGAIEAECNRLGFEEIPPVQAQRGDLVLLLADTGQELSITERGSLGVIGTCGLPVFVDTDGLLEAPLETVRRAWKV